MDGLDAESQTLYGRQARVSRPTVRRRHQPVSPRTQLRTNAPGSPAGLWRHQSRARQPLDNGRDARLGLLRVFTVRERTVLGTGPQLDDVVKAEDAAADRASDARQPARQRAQVLIRPEAYPVARPPKLSVRVLGCLDWRRPFRVHGVPPQAPHPLATCAHARRAMPPTR